MRLVFRLTLVVSLLVALVVACWWARSYFAHDAVMVYRGQSASALHSSRGQVLLVRGRAARDVGGLVRWHRGPAMPLRGPNVERALDEVHVARIDDEHLASVPHWLLFLAAALPAAIVGMGIVRRRRRLRWAGTSGETAGSS